MHNGGMKYLSAFLFLIASPALANSPQTSFEAMHQCVLREAHSCRDYFTKDSMPLFQKIITYDVARCVPQEVNYVSEIPAGTTQIVRVQVKEKEKTHIARLAYRKESGEWKMSLPETLRRGLGEKWQNYVNITEQAYLFMRSQMGSQMSCEAVEALVVPKNQQQP